MKTLTIWDHESIYHFYQVNILTRNLVSLYNLFKSRSLHVCWNCQVSSWSAALNLLTLLLKKHNRSQSVDDSGPPIPWNQFQPFHFFFFFLKEIRILFLRNDEIIMNWFLLNFSKLKFYEQRNSFKSIIRRN